MEFCLSQKFWQCSTAEESMLEHFFYHELTGQFTHANDFTPMVLELNSYIMMTLKFDFWNMRLPAKKQAYTKLHQPCHRQVEKLITLGHLEINFCTYRVACNNSLISYPCNCILKTRRLITFCDSAKSKSRSLSKLQYENW